MRIVRRTDYEAMEEIALDLAGLLISAGVMAAIVFLAGGWI